jgi:hypothetical protein
MASEPTRHARGGDWLFDDQETDEAFRELRRPADANWEPARTMQQKAPPEQAFSGMGAAGFEPAPLAYEE